MKVVMTLLARNEADIVGAQIAYHLHAGVDFVIATDNGSDDGTLEVLKRYEKTGLLHLLQEPGDDIRQPEWVTRMARMAASEFRADWIINADADEFWWPRGGTLKEVLRLVPARYGVVRGSWRHFLPLYEGDPDFAERMTVRLRAPAHPGTKSTIYHAHQKVAHRADPEVEIERGNHNAIGRNLEPLRTWHPIEVLHFSVRSLEQFERKARGGWVRSPEELVEHKEQFVRAAGEGRLDAYFAEHAVSGPALERGLADRTLAIDTRLRDALRVLRGSDGTYRLPQSGGPLLTFEQPSVADATDYAAEVSVLASIDGVVRAEERVQALEERLAGLRTLRRR